MKPNDPLVSIAVTTYNGARFLAALLDSLVGQTYRPIEIVVCDDHSNDSTADILDEYRRRYPELLTWHRNDSNIGYIRNFEKALSCCTGECLAPCDQDDIWAPDKIEILVRTIGDRELIHSDARVIDAEGRTLSESFSLHAKKKVGANSFKEIIAENVVTGCTCMVKRTLLTRAVPFPENVPHDFWLALLASTTGSIGYVDKALTDYRQHDRNAIGAKNRNVDAGMKIRGFSVGGFFRNRDTIMANRWARYRSLHAALSNRVPPESSRIVSRLADYYGSYFTKRLRLKAFMFHLLHGYMFQSHKTVANRISDVLLSLIGHPGAMRKVSPDGKPAVLDV